MNDQSDQWSPDWHVVQLQYKELDGRIRPLGFLGHPSHTSSLVWFCKVAPTHEWCRIDKGYNQAIRILLAFYGLPTTSGRTLTWPQGWRDRWLDFSDEYSENTPVLTKRATMDLERPDFVDRFILNGPIGYMLGLLWTVKIMFFGISKSDLDHE